MSMATPNLFIVGAMKSATSTLHNYIKAHPGAFMCEPKEPGYFVDELNWFRGESWYLSLFADAGDRPIVGESSTEYTKAPRYAGVPERIARFNQEARFIYVMRDPIERTISHYWHTVVHDAEHRTMLRAIQEEPLYRQISDYRMQIEPYLTIFGRERVLTLSFEELKDSPKRVCQHVFEWLELDSTFVPPNLGERANETPRMVEQVKGRGMLHRFRYSGFWNKIGPTVPPSVRRIARKFSEKRFDRTIESTHEVVEYLRPEQRGQAAALAALLGREFPEWTTLYGDGTPELMPRAGKSHGFLAGT